VHYQENSKKPESTDYLGHTTFVPKRFIKNNTVQIH